MQGLAQTEVLVQVGVWAPGVVLLHVHLVAPSWELAGSPSSVANRSMELMVNGGKWCVGHGTEYNRPITEACASAIVQG